MRGLILILLVGICALFGVAAEGEAGGWSLLWQGRLTDVAGMPVTTNVDVSVGITDGSPQYDHTVSNVPMAAGSVTVRDGTYTWTDTGGSSNPTFFDCEVDLQAGTVRVSYPLVPPDNGIRITVDYAYSVPSDIAAVL